jgi:chemotaxis protein MotB
MTAMFIIFLMLWIINQSTPEQKVSIAEYFAPVSASRNPSGSGQMLNGETISKDGALRNPSAPLGTPGGGPSLPKDGDGNTDVPGFPGAQPKPLGIEAEPGALSGQKTPAPPAAEVERQVRQALQGVPELQGFQANVQFAQTQDGTRIDLIDNEKQELFPKGSSRMLPQTERLMAQVAKIIASVPNKVAISGHTDSVAFGPRSQYDNWDLSADRANSSRRALTKNGIADDRIASVEGKADREPKVPEDPKAASNRRISITLLNEPVPPAPAGGTGATSAAAPVQPPPPGPDGRLIPRQ